VVYGHLPLFCVFAVQSEETVIGHREGNDLLAAICGCSETSCCLFVALGQQAVTAGGARSSPSVQEATDGMPGNARRERSHHG
jgi:hypothetical protein